MVRGCIPLNLRSNGRWVGGYEKNSASSSLELAIHLIHLTIVLVLRTLFVTLRRALFLVIEPLLMLSPKRLNRARLLLCFDDDVLEASTRLEHREHAGRQLAAWLHLEPTLVRERLDLATIVGSRPFAIVFRGRKLLGALETTNIIVRSL
jgi:hypothetical protein